jgi:NADH:ubiquinone oxidoreductase subunit
LCGFKILNISFKMIFTWWKKQPFGTFLKTLFYGIYVGKDENGNKYYKSKKNQRWIVYSNNIEATQITSDWYMWIHHTVDKIPEEKDTKKYFWQKNHLENQTGTKNSYKPTKIKRDNIKKKYETWK